MKSHIDKILEKMKLPSYGELYADYIFKLTNESERGALLIGVGKVEEYLEKLVVQILPVQQKTYKARLFNYPGPLSSFNGKIELLYAFRILDKRLYDSLTVLRKLRNNAAHSSDSYSIQEFKENLEMIYDFEDNLKIIVHELALKNLMKWKENAIKDALKDGGFDLEEYKHLVTERLQNPEMEKIIQEQLTIWKLAHGLTFICLKLDVLTDEYSFLCKSDKTWID